MTDNEITIKAYAECCDQSEEFQFKPDDAIELLVAITRAEAWICGCKQEASGYANDCQYPEKNCCKSSLGCNACEIVINDRLEKNK